MSADVKVDVRHALPTRERLQRFALGALIILSASLSVALGSVVFGWLASDGWFLIVVAIPLGVASVDVISGFVHWLCDTFGSADTPVFGQLIRSFREHHDDPSAMVHHDWIETNGACCLLTSTTLVILSPIAALVDSPVAAFVVTYVWTMATVGAASSQIHKWAHMEHAPRIASILQSSRLALSPTEHSQHHRAPYKSGYCITTGWSNAVLDRIGWWSWLERRIRRTK